MDSNRHVCFHKSKIYFVAVARLGLEFFLEEYFLSLCDALVTAEWPLRAWAVPCGQTSGLSELRVTVAPATPPPTLALLLGIWLDPRARAQAL